MGFIKEYISTSQITKRIQELGQLIAQDYKKSQAQKILVLGVLKGAFIFMADLIRATDYPVECEFVRISSYRGGMQSGQLELIHGITPDKIRGQHILIVEDIVDTGNTLSFLNEYLKQYSPASIKICTLLFKKEMFHGSFEINYIGFTIPTVFVVGYGLDVGELYRNYPSIGEWKEADK